MHPKQVFHNISEFIAIRNHCIFCGISLQPIFTNFVGMNKEIPIIHAPLNNDGKFYFHLQYYSISDSIDAHVSVSIYNNQVNFYSAPITNQNDNIYLASMPSAVNILENMKPHVELRCYNNECKMSYYVSSDFFRFNSYPLTIPEIRPFMLYMECFNLDDKSWVQNNWINNQTNIYSIPHYNTEPIRFSMIDFDSMEKDKLINRLHTMITFN